VQSALHVCIVPFTRGEEPEPGIEEIVAECRALVAGGVRKSLCGANCDHYAKREMAVNDGKTAFVQLLEAVHEIDGLERIRLPPRIPKVTGTTWWTLTPACPSWWRARTFPSKAAVTACSS